MWEGSNFSVSVYLSPFLSSPPILSSSLFIIISHYQCILYVYSYLKSQIYKIHLRKFLQTSRKEEEALKPKRYHLAIGSWRLALNFPGVCAHDQVASVLNTGTVRYQSIVSIEKAYAVLVIRPFWLFSAAGIINSERKCRVADLFQPSILRMSCQKYYLK